MAEVKIQQFPWKHDLSDPSNETLVTMAVIHDGDAAYRVEVSDTANARESDLAFGDAIKAIVEHAYRLGKESR